MTDERFARLCQDVVEWIGRRIIAADIGGAAAPAAREAGAEDSIPF